jgi:hypothetical protein
VLDELRYEWRRLQTFVEWPLERPRPAELAKVCIVYIAYIVVYIVQLELAKVYIVHIGYINICRVAYRAPPPR